MNSGYQRKVALQNLFHGGYGFVIYSERQKKEKRGGERETNRRTTKLKLNVILRAKVWWFSD